MSPDNVPAKPEIQQVAPATIASGGVPIEVQLAVQIEVGQRWQSNRSISIPRLSIILREVRKDGTNIYLVELFFWGIGAFEAYMTREQIICWISVHDSRLLPNPNKPIEV